MGAVVKVFCESCHAEWNCNTGCGMLHGMLENVAPLFPKDVADALMQYTGGDERTAYDFGFQPAVCGHCGGIVSVPVLRLPDGGGQHVGLCPNCGKGVRPIKVMAKTHCPVCKKNTLKTLETGRWD